MSIRCPSTALLSWGFWCSSEPWLREYLLGQKCIIFTDNNPLNHLTTDKLRAMEQHWAVQLATFYFEGRYRSGRCNQNVDALSKQDPSGQCELECLPACTVISAIVKQAREQIWFPRLQWLHYLVSWWIYSPYKSRIGEALLLWRHEVTPHLEEHQQLFYGCGDLATSVGPPVTIGQDTALARLLSSLRWRGAPAGVAIDVAWWGLNSITPGARVSRSWVHHLVAAEVVLLIRPDIWGGTIMSRMWTVSGLNFEFSLHAVYSEVLHYPLSLSR